MTAPRVAPTTAEPKPTRSAVREPWISRDSTSRPKASVPSQCAVLGAASMAPKSTASGSYGASGPAKTPTTIIPSTTTAPIAPRVRRRAKSRTAAHPRALDDGSVSSVAAWSIGEVMAMVLAVADARVEPGVHAIHQEIHHDEDPGHQHHEGLDQRVVPVGHRLDQEQPDAVEVEDLLGDHEPADEEGELQRHHRP